MDKSKAKCPKCKSNNLTISEYWRGHSKTWEQRDGLLDRQNGAEEIGDPYKVMAKCDDCGHGWWRLRALQVTDIIIY